MDLKRIVAVVQTGIFILIWFRLLPSAFYGEPVLSPVWCCARRLCMVSIFLVLGASMYVYPFLYEMVGNESAALSLWGLALPLFLVAGVLVGFPLTCRRCYAYRTYVACGLPLIFSAVGAFLILFFLTSVLFLSSFFFRSLVSG